MARFTPKAFLTRPACGLGSSPSSSKSFPLTGRLRAVGTPSPRLGVGSLEGERTAPSAVVSEVLKMEQKTEFVVVPESALLRAEETNRYGSVPGLDDEELADPRELERHIMLEEWEPVLTLPAPSERGAIGGPTDQFSSSGWSAFGAVASERITAGVDKARSKADEFREELRHVIIMMQIVGGRLPKARFQVLSYLRRGIIDLEHIENADMLALGKHYLRARCLQKRMGQAVGAAR